MVVENSLSIDQVLEQIGSVGKFQHRLLLLCGCGYFAVCAELLVFVLVADPVQQEFEISRHTYSWLPFTATVCSFIGGSIFGVWADIRGRQFPFIVSVCAAAIAGLASAFAPSWPWLLFLRGVTALSVGGITAIDFVLFLECAPAESRGKFTVSITAYGAFGVLLVAGSGWVLIPTYGWRYLAAAMSIPSFIVGIIRFFVTEESPRFLLMAGRTSDAALVLRRIAQINGFSDFQLRSSHLQQPLISDTPQHGFKKLFSKEYKRTTLLAIAIWFFHFSGYWGITMYLPAYLAQMNANQYGIFMLMVAAEIPGLLLLMYCIDRKSCGRLGSLRWFTFAAAVSTAAFAMCQKDTMFMAFLAMMVYFFTIPVFAVLFTYTPELYPTQRRTTAMALMNTVSSIPGMFIPFVSATLLSLEPKWIYPATWASCFAIAAVISLFLTIETAHQPLDNNTGTSTELTPIK